MILGHPGGPDVITRVSEKGRQGSQSQRRLRMIEVELKWCAEGAISPGMCAAPGLCAASGRQKRQGNRSSPEPAEGMQPQ